ncbi:MULTISPECIES: cytochrome c oxidase subunit 2A [Nosocomiicoccus]|uniref:Cytochrome c oxidase subunit 2A n=1 Tax=Nosocomiicoccus massiliensis TaxID=1232430 RepID=A0AAF1BNP0_9STAP|nr:MULTISPECIES: cytochrome c oxidase subunit 2A [Nosocomiicoccus]MDK6862547.1 cytochrome c oxidase subunit 2A [Nosocomiicoccus ampullae]OFO51717.1 hypothetical protein HMPREF3029_07005 [Nosocomiicoccus sp. HMSC059G07]OFS64109.1 hypothetical protein HMPREF3177_00845 [Nosocomiicoccus sp. HMSC09A07]WOS96395.1 cytochrome c oxidase subunit 2A [Nosocomiicoccus massiliensis]
MADKKVVHQNDDKDIVKNENVTEDVHNLDLRGTFFFTMALGALMLVSWLGVFWLFMERM